jgi:hypothetical protein
MNEKEFAEYVYSYYGYKGIFDMYVSMPEILRAIEVRKVFHQVPFECDSLDREMIRDIILAIRGVK